MTAILEGIAGARIARIDSPALDIVCLTLHARDLRAALVAHLSGPTRGLYLLSKRPEGSPASPAITKLRHHAQGARIKRAERRGRSDLVLELAQRGRASHLVLRLAPRRGNAIVLAADQRVLTSLHRLESSVLELSPEAEGASPWPTTLDAMRAAGAGLRDTPGDSAAEATRQPLLRAIARRRKQLRRRLTAIEGDLKRQPEIDALRQRANLLISNLHRLSDNTAGVAVPDPTTDARTTLEIEIDPERTPAAQAQAWFTRARKLTRGIAIARERHALTERELASLDELHATALTAADAELETLRNKVALAGVGWDPPATRPARRPQHKPFREFLGAGGRVIRVGKGAADNDALTLHHAAPHDLWLHARGQAGAHVVVPLGRSEACPPDLLVDAGLLAAHYSKARSHDTVEIVYVPRRHVRKPKGSPPGSVNVQREKVMALRRNEERLRSLLASERHRA
ncbi:MAG: NFACT RNA binding domain-containing protein [Myxococcales bacterium]|nr:NFACT RNA binding domain-containing protein [Myxococcales bacterium]